jgi:DNA mismatch repair protein MutL
VNVHPSKTEVRFRQSSHVHDMVRDAVRSALMAARPVPQFLREISAQPTATPALTPHNFTGRAAAEAQGALLATATDFALEPQRLPPQNQRLGFTAGIEVEGGVRAPVAVRQQVPGDRANCGGSIEVEEEHAYEAAVQLASLKPLGQIRNSFILAVNGEGLWIIDQHVAHERILFERILRQRAAGKVEGQRLLMPIIVELLPDQQAVFAEVGEELENSGFEAEPFGARTLAVKTAPAGVDASSVERLLHELLEQLERERQATSLDQLRAGIAASIACHAAIKVNMRLEQNKMEWLLAELARTECPMTCPHGRPVVLRYSLNDIQRAFKRI